MNETNVFYTFQLTSNQHFVNNELLYIHIKIKQTGKHLQLLWKYTRCYNLQLEEKIKFPLFHYNLVKSIQVSRIILY